MADDPPSPGPIVPALDVLIEHDAWTQAEPAIEAICVAAVGATLAACRRAADDHELSVVLSDDAAVRALNRDYRGQDKATNVLSFALQDTAPLDALPGYPVALGDVVLAFETTRDEAARQGITLRDHASHLVVHGVLHLLGFDHMEPLQADEMERLERRILADLGIADPYADSAPVLAAIGQEQRP